MKKFITLLLIAIFTVTSFSVTSVSAYTRGKHTVKAYRKKNGTYVKSHKANRYYKTKSHSHHKHKR